MSIHAARTPTEPSVSPNLRDALACLEGVPLEETRSAALFDRTDTKYILPVQSVPEILARCAPSYRVVEVSGRRLCRYRTQYFDSADLLFYRMHHDGRAHRHKVRIRTYEDGASFLEVKVRNNHGRTLKSRVAVESPGFGALERLDDEAFRSAAVPVPPAALHPVLRVDYTRLTLINRHEVERVTIDLMLRYTAGAAHAAFPGIAVVEVKQTRRQPTEVPVALRELRVPEGGISKYCLGVVQLRPDARINRFKPVMRRITGMTS